MRALPADAVNRQEGQAMRNSDDDFDALDFLLNIFFALVSIAVLLAVIIFILFM